PGGQGRVTADVGALRADLADTAHDDVFDQCGVDTGAPHQFLQGFGGQLDGMPTGEGAVSFTDRCTDGFDDDGNRHCVPFCERDGKKGTGRRKGASPWTETLRATRAGAG